MPGQIMSKNVSDQLVEMLVAAGVKRLYAVTGDSLNPLNEAIRQNGKIKWIHVRHEEAGAYAAAAEAELGGIGCCAGSSGPGHVHLINGLYDAHHNHVPVIAIASTIETNQFGTDYFQSTNTLKLFDDCSHYNQIATTAAQAPRMLQTAIQHAIHKRGVSVLGLPGDVAAMKAEESETSMNIFKPKSHFFPQEEELARLAALIGEYEKIVLFCGIGAADAHDEVIQLAAMLKAPVGYTFRSKMQIQYDNPYEVGMTGLLGMPSAYKAMHEADLILLLGTDFPYTPFMPTKCKIVQIDNRPERLGRRAKLDMGLAGDVKDTLLKLMPLLKINEDSDFLRSQLETYEEVKKHFLSFSSHKGERDNIQPEYVAATINELADSDAIFTLDTGMSCVWGARYIQATGKRHFLGSFNHGSMANAMPMAMGASLLYPDRQVIALCGDGGISMLLGDLATISQYKLPVKLVIFNNRSLGMVKLEMEVAGLMDNQTDMYNPDFTAVAEAMGIKGIDVHEPDYLPSALRKAFQIDGPVLLNVMTNPDALAMPPRVEWDHLIGMGTSMLKLMLHGRFSELVGTVKSNYKHLTELV